MGEGKSLLGQLKKLRRSRTVIVTIGNILKGDDAAGSLLFDRLNQAGISAEMIDAGTVPENYIQYIIKKAPENILVVDAMDFAAPPGTVRIFEPEQLDSSIYCTHSLSPRVFADIIRRNVEVDVYFIGIQPCGMQFGQPVSEQVKRAVEQLSLVLVEVFA